MLESIGNPTPFFCQNLILPHPLLKKSSLVLTLTKKSLLCSSSNILMESIHLLVNISSNQNLLVKLSTRLYCPLNQLKRMSQLTYLFLTTVLISKISSLKRFMTNYSHIIPLTISLTLNLLFSPKSSKYTCSIQRNKMFVKPLLINILRLAIFFL